MFALVKAGQVIKELRGGEPYTNEAGTQYPASIFFVWSVDELIAINIYPLIITSNNLDSKTEKETGSYEYTINDKSVSKLKAKSDLDIDKVKTNEISTVKGTQNNALSSTDWYYIRKTDKGTAIPTDVQNYRDAVRVVGDKMVSDIMAVSDKAGFQALYPVWNEDKENIGGTLGIWPDPEDYNL
ncbi:MAG: hypothetical protein CL831_00375 [Crocinitomicaceae bacterium]|nr:hypothetical protein [Crocinitomicaceae bacterium]